MGALSRLRVDLVGPESLSINAMASIPTRSGGRQSTEKREIFLFHSRELDYAGTVFLIAKLH